MKLGLKSILAVSVALAVALALVYIVSERVVLAGFVDLEQAQSRQASDRCRAILDDESNELSIKLSDWSSWDDMYQFVTDRNDRFISTNLGVESLVQLGLSQLIVLDATGREVWLGGPGVDRRSISPAPPELADKVKSLAGRGSAKGVVRLGCGEFLVATRPILPSDGRGTARGTVAFVRELGGISASRIARLAKVDVLLSAAERASSPLDVVAAEASLRGGLDKAVAYPHVGMVSCYTMIPDIEGVPAFVLRSEMPRSVYGQGVSSARYWYAGVGILGLAFGVTTVLLVSRLVIARVTRLSSAVAGVGATNQFSARLSISGRDEISQLAAAINAMLSEIERSHAGLRASEERFRSLAEGTPVLVWMSDTTKACTYFNTNWLRFTGRTLEQELGDGWAQGVHEDDLSRCLNIYTTEFDARRSFEMKYRLRNAQGEYRWVLDHAVPRFGDQGEFLGYIGSCIDITDSYQVEQRIAESEGKFRAMFEHSPIGICLTDESGLVLQANREFARILHFDAGLSDGLTIASFGAGACAGCEVLAAEGLAGPIERVYLDAEGGRVPVLVNATIIRRSGQASLVWRFVQDITARRAAETGLQLQTAQLLHAQRELESQAVVLSERAIELELARAAAESANHAKSRFLANMSHEIRTPMSAILGFSDLLAEEGHTPAQRAEHVRTIRASGQHLMSVINDILDLSKIEAQKMTIESIGFSPSDVFVDVRRMMADRAAAKGLTLGVEFDSPIPATITSDPTRLRQILVNLVGNAIKFTEHGGVRVGVAFDRSNAADPRLTLCVADTGLGMSRDQIEKLFQPFTQADTSTTRRFGGSGLGLAITWHLTQLLGGAVSVTSEPGRGSAFTVSIPTGPIDSTPMVDRFDHHAGTSAQGLGASVQPVVLRGRILLAEDGEDNQRLIGFYLRRGGADLAIACNGREAVELVGRAVTQANPFQLILMDTHMPVLDGLEATRELRAMGVSTPIVALTAGAMAEDRERCLLAGSDDFATKPIQREALLELCRKWLGKKGRATDGTRTRDLKDHNLAL